MAGWTDPKTWAAQILSSADLNAHVRDNLNYLKANIGLGAPTELTIAGGVITKTKANHSIDTEAAAAADDLDTIDGGSDGDIIFLRAVNDAHTVIVKNDTGNIHCGGDIYLDDTHKIVSFMFSAALSEWHPVGAYSVARTFVRNTFEFPAADWVADVKGATLAQNKAGKKCWLPLSFFKIGDILVSYKLVGDADVGTALTLDCKLVRINKEDPITTTDIPGGAIAQVTANANFDVEAILTDPEVIATDKQYVLEILGTTTGGDTIIVMGAEITAIRLL